MLLLFHPRPACGPPPGRWRVLNDARAIVLNASQPRGRVMRDWRERDDVDARRCILRCASPLLGLAGLQVEFGCGDIRIGDTLKPHALAKPCD